MPAVPNDVFFATIPELNTRLKAKEFSAEELTRAFSGRLQQLGPRITRWRCFCRRSRTARPRKSIKK
jgi:Asp-tRNA(Asn)/Glu-tRNA(Gln) amidotransferase A subunit family amidase